MPIRLRSIDRHFARFYRTGDAEALGRVFDATARELLHVAAWLAGNRTDAEDLLQRTFLTAIEDHASFARQRRVWNSSSVTIPRRISTRARVGCCSSCTSNAPAGTASNRAEPVVSVRA